VKRTGGARTACESGGSWGAWRARHVTAVAELRIEQLALFEDEAGTRGTPGHHLDDDGRLARRRGGEAARQAELRRWS
jgi:hypothetical protein